MNHPEEISKLSKLKAQITEVKGIMMDNIEKVCICFLEKWYDCGKNGCVIFKVEIKCLVAVFFSLWYADFCGYRCTCLYSINLKLLMLC